MERIASFEQFKNNEKPEIVNNEDGLSVTNENNNDDRKHYMFFRNLASVKHNIEEMLGMDPDKIDELLENGHDWAADHIATSKDDIQEVTEWLRGEFETSDDEDEGEEEEVDDEAEDDEEEEEAEDETEELEDEEEEVDVEAEEDETEDEETTKQQI